MSDQTCKTCKHWGEEPPQGDRDVDVQDTAGKVCGVAWHMEEVKPVEPSGIAVLDGSGFWGAVVTGPDFGCVRHEPK